MGKQKIKNRFLIDFMTITFRQSCNMTPEQVLDYFCSFFSHPEVQPVNFLKLDKGLPGYNKSYRFMGESIISVSWHDSYPAHGIMLNLTGQGCSFFKRDELVKFYESCKADQLNFKVTRIDIAYDDFHGFIPVDEMVEAVDTHLDGYRIINTRIDVNNMEKIGFHYAGQSGVNLNFGTKGSNFFVRLYDKRREQKLKELDYWKRFEVQLRHEEATTFMETLSEGEKIQTAFVALLDRKIRFTDGRYEYNLSQSPTVDWWADFLKILTAARFQNIRTAIDRLKYTFKE